MYEFVRTILFVGKLPTLSHIHRLIMLLEQYAAAISRTAHICRLYSSNFTCCFCASRREMLLCDGYRIAAIPSISLVSRLSYSTCAMREDVERAEAATTPGLDKPCSFH